MPANKTSKARKRAMPPRTAAAMIDHVRTKSIRLCLKKHGPIYVRAVVPEYARKDFELQDYSAWYISHVDPKFVEFENVDRYLNEYDGCDVTLEGFMSFLESKGYIVFNSAHEDGVIVLDWEA